jgi:hypothetical protein
MAKLALGVTLFTYQPAKILHYAPHVGFISHNWRLYQFDKVQRTA